MVRDAIASSGLAVKLAIDYKGGTLVTIGAEVCLCSGVAFAVV